MSSRQPSRILILLAAGAVVMRSMFPAGYMVGDWSQGQWMVLCHQGLTVSLDDHAHHHDDSEQSTAICFCDQDLGLDKTLLGWASDARVSAWLPQALPDTNYPRIAYRQRDGLYPARAPPTLRPRLDTI